MNKYIVQYSTVTYKSHGESNKLVDKYMVNAVCSFSQFWKLPLSLKIGAALSESTGISF